MIIMVMSCYGCCLVKSQPFLVLIVYLEENGGKDYIVISCNFIDT